MSQRKVGRNEQCPCGSGKKYKKCCLQSEAGTQAGAGFRQIPMSDELNAMLLEQQQRFRDVHGKDPGPEDPVFFDSPHLELVEHEMVQGLQEAGIDPAKVHAFIETGLMPTEMNVEHIPANDLKAWQDAVQRYEQEHGQSLPTPPWNKSEWANMKTESLEENKKFWDFFEEFKSDLFADQESIEYRFKFLVLQLSDDPDAELETKDEAWFEQQLESLASNRKSILGILETVLAVTMGDTIDDRSVVELVFVTEEVVHKALERLGLEIDDEFERNLDCLRSISFLKFGCAIDRQFGISDREPF